MAVNQVERFVHAPVTTLSTITAANIVRDGSGTLATLFTASADGARLLWISFSPQEDITTDDLIRLYLHDAGSAYSHIGTVRVPHNLYGPGTFPDSPLIWTPPGGFLDMQASYVIKGGCVQGLDLDTIAAGYSLAA